jgi:hypothetical protein
VTDADALAGILAAVAGRIDDDMSERDVVDRLTDLLDEYEREGRSAPPCR